MVFRQSNARVNISPPRVLLGGRLVRGAQVASLSAAQFGDWTFEVNGIGAGRDILRWVRGARTVSLRFRGDRAAPVSKQNPEYRGRVFVTSFDDQMFIQPRRTFRALLLGSGPLRRAVRP